MSYTITTSDGSLTITIPDGQFDNTTSLTLPGPNAVGYGQFLDQNLLQLLENFASNASPSGENVQGQLWFNKSNKTLNVFTGEQGYLPVSGIVISSTQPVNANPGNTWYDTTHNQYFIYDGAGWNLIGPLYTKSQGVSGAIPTSIADATLVGVYHNVIQLQFGNNILAILNGDSRFTPSPAISGFPQVFHGLTLNNNLFPGNDQFYTNANAAAYIPVDPTIIGIENSISALSSTVNTNLATTNANIVTANSAVVSYVNSQISSVNSSWLANAAIQESEISGLRANINAANVSLTTAWTANAVSQQVQINSLITGAYSNANVAAYLAQNTGQITASTQLYNDKSTNVATTAFVQSVFPQGMIMMWNSTAAPIPTGFQLCDGTNGTPDLRGQFIVGAGGSYTNGSTGGCTSVTLATTNLPAHTHTFSTSSSGTSGSAGSHTHAVSTTIADAGHTHSTNESPHSHTTHFNRTSKGNNATPYMISDPNYGENFNGSVDLPTTSALTGITLQPSLTGITASTSVTGVGDHAHSIALSMSGTTDSTGSASSFNILPPYYALCYIQKMF
jgi:hypothetical protein